MNSRALLRFLACTTGLLCLIIQLIRHLLKVSSFLLFKINFTTVMFREIKLFLHCLLFYIGSHLIRFVLLIKDNKLDIERWDYKGCIFLHTTKWLGCDLDSYFCFMCRLSLCDLTPILPKVIAKLYWCASRIHSSCL